MTIVAAMIDADGSVLMGADSIGCAGWDKIVRRDPKVFVRDRYVIGYEGSFRFGQVLRYQGVMPTPLPGADLFQFMVTEFVERLRSALRTTGVLKIENNVETGGKFMVGLDGRLFTVGSDLQVGESYAPYAAIGCGFAYALGAMRVAQGSTLERVTSGLETAVEFSAGCAPPFVFAKSPPP